MFASSMPGASSQTKKGRGKETAHKVYKTTKKGSNCPERNIYLSPFLGSVFLPSCMLSERVDLTLPVLMSRLCTSWAPVVSPDREPWWLRGRSMDSELVWRLVRDW